MSGYEGPRRTSPPRDISSPPRGVPKKSLSGNTVIWSPEFVADPCPFSACQLLSHRRLPFCFPQVSINGNSGRPVDAKDSTQASINKGL